MDGVSIRHELNDYLEMRAGHIGYGIRPEFRGRGYATEILLRALKIVRELGVLENVIETEDGEKVRRYWFVAPD